MATGAQLRILLAPLTGISLASLDRYFVDLAEHQLVRRPGPGRPDIELTALEEAAVLLSLASPRPQGAAAAARALGNLMPDPREGDASLLTQLAATLERMEWSLQQRGAALDFADPDWELTLCLDPLRAIMVWTSRGPQATRRFLPYVDAKTVAPATQPPPAFRRDFVLTQPALVAVARLHAGLNDGADPLPGGPAPNPPTSRHARVAEQSASLTSTDLNGRVRVSANTGDTHARASPSAADLSGMP